MRFTSREAKRTGSKTYMIGQHPPCDAAKSAPDDDMVRDLAVSVGNAISEWAKKYHLEQLPRDVLLDQAIAIIETVKESM